ncbi:hypothetical protein QBC34DRAFT_454611 [Podospora aff. communis PSN243]|uniref:Uncharacterized protein n=1 Tax=Podospora aff. communis PSN243 TaxID=3040156 RepID=A0AAV9G0N1_9PEZI|nr:hypothetical protein QBC34DRAFT_454611 [Podospora aff. communis PSN243]
MAFPWMCCGKRPDKGVQAPASSTCRDQAVVSKNSPTAAHPNHSSDQPLHSNGDVALERAADEKKRRQQVADQELEAHYRLRMQDEEFKAERIKSDERYRQYEHDAAERKAMQETLDRRAEEFERDCSRREEIRAAEARRDDMSYGATSYSHEPSYSHQPTITYEPTASYEPPASYEPAYVYEPPASYDTGYNPYGSGNY